MKTHKNRINRLIARLGVGACLMTLAATQAVALPNQLCSEANDESNYDSAFLKSFETLREGEGGWLFRDHDLATGFGPDKTGMKQLKRFQSELSDRGITLVMVPIPTRSLVHPEYLGSVDFNRNKARAAYVKYLSRLRKAGVVVPDLEDLLQERADKPMFFARDHHWNHHGARTIARMTAAQIRQQPAYKELEPKSYDSFYTSKARNAGSYAKAAKQLCGINYPSEPYKIYQTADAGMDLFGEAESRQPEITLVGTSNSKGKLRLNFSGFLQDYAKSDVLNLALSGGGYDQSIIEYLQSQEFQQNPPTFLVWELPSYYRLNDKAFYQKVFKALGGKS